MQRAFGLAGVATLLLAAGQVSARPSVTFDFEDLTDQGWGTGFGDDASMNWPIINVAGSNRMQIVRNSFQSAGVAHGADFTPFYNTMLDAASNEAGYEISYDWYVDTSTGGFGSFLQLGTFVNTGSGYYAQDFGAIKEVELNGTQLASGGVFSGHVVINMAAVGFNMPAADTFFRLGLIMNGGGAADTVYFDNITVAPIVPEPGSLALLAFAVPALTIHRRRGG